MIAWGDVPTWVGVVAAIGAGIAAGGLLFVEVQRDRRRSAAESRTQAERIAAWPDVVRSDPSDPDSAPRWGVHVHVGGDLPVYQLHVEHIGGDAESVVVVEVVPPGDWLLSGRTLYRRPETPLAVDGPQPPTERLFQVALTFDDAAGGRWHRDVRGELRRVT